MPVQALTAALTHAIMCAVSQTLDTPHRPTAMHKHLFTCRVLRCAAFGVLAMLHTVTWADATESPSIESVAQLYLKTFVNDDAAAGRALNAYLKPAFGEHGALHPAALGRVQQMTQEEWEKELPRLVGAAPTPQARTDLTAALHSLYMATQRQAHRAQCQVDQVVHAIDNGETQATLNKVPMDSAQVKFSCRIPTASASTRATLLRADERLDHRSMRRHAQTFLNEVKSGRFHTTVSGSQTLHKRPGTQGPWLVEDNTPWLWPVYDDMPDPLATVAR